MTAHKLVEVHAHRHAARGDMVLFSEASSSKWRARQLAMDGYADVRIVDRDGYCVTCDAPRMCEAVAAE